MGERHSGIGQSGNGGFVDGFSEPLTWPVVAAQREEQLELVYRGAVSFYTLSPGYMPHNEQKRRLCPLVKEGLRVSDEQFARNVGRTPIRHHRVLQKGQRGPGHLLYCAHPMSCNLKPSL